MPLHITITTPQKTLLEVQADEIIIPTISGEITILPSHVPLLSQIAPGEVTIKKASQIDQLAITGGFVEIGNDQVSILADYAVHGKDISAVKAQEAKERAEKAMNEKLSDKDFRIAEAELQKAMLELKIANKIKHKNQI